ncbi:MAG TPA: TonB family protein [Candidatus Acidoferrales bacterium]|nr:TonB family protein [Candidatus Acidoferrales bacterium]
MIRITAATAALAFALAATPAFAQYANEFTPAKVTHQGTTTHDIAGSGTVRVKVQVNADGTHKVIQVESSTNPGDNAAAVEIAQNSSYSPAHRGKMPVDSFYTFRLRFSGKAVVANEEESAIASQAGGVDVSGIDALVRGGKYKDAIAKANEALASSPGNPAVLQLLGAAQYFDNDFVDAATSFSRVDDIKKPFQSIAAQSFAAGSVRVSQSDPSESLDWARKAVAVSGGDANSRFALGVAQLANKQYPDALATLKSVHDSMIADPKSDSKAKLQVDQELLQAYLATNDTASASSLAAEMKALDPSGGDAAAHAIAVHYLQLGGDAMTAKKFGDAVKYFDQAANAGSSADVVTANYSAALAIENMGPSDKPDYSKAKGYAIKAVTAAPDDPMANFAAGIAYADTYAAGRNRDDRAQALTYLNKADQLAKAAGNLAFAQQIEAQIKNIPQ